jgi:hypothetical protein
MVPKLEEKGRKLTKSAIPILAPTGLYPNSRSFGQAEPWIKRMK